MATVNPEAADEGVYVPGYCYIPSTSEVYKLLESCKELLQEHREVVSEELAKSEKPDHQQRIVDAHHHLLIQHSRRNARGPWEPAIQHNPTPRSRHQRNTMIAPAPGPRSQ
ncbi:protein canopy 3 isoform X1-like protein [Anopheles sinensis]|uniref:Protein canopy 3 isoform X1-like protein n=1 Tax=Anopheles sinensis TaxID=74873 RepID=A0A084VBD7_ANOSI|nr:protein canopy 3 isoform X1-like protein [Anopheles sinensis]